jgi:hypothetical protein
MGIMNIYEYRHKYVLEKYRNTGKETHWNTGSDKYRNAELLEMIILDC